ncbi:MAG TPA: OsmC family protein [Solirubrobacterales bacterium]|nr:OsmC family protein [Solirubrobacterales bacterium]
MPVRQAQAEWHGSFASGDGKMSFGSGAFEGSYSAASRFEEGEGTNPEELIAAAHAGCFSMAFALALSEAGHEPDSVETTAEVHIDKDDGGFSITRSNLTTEVKVEGLGEEEFQKLADEAKQGCPVSRALGAIEIGLDAKLA